MSLFRDLLIEKKRKPYYCEVEYLESTGTQYINTGCSFVKSTDEIELYYMITEFGSSYSWGFGSLESGAIYGISGVNSTNGCRFSYGTTTANFSLGTQSTTQHYLVMNDSGMYNDNVQVKSGSEVTINGTWNNFLFALSYNAQGGASYYAKERIWRYTHKRNGVLIRDLIPVLDWNMTPCMYDKVTRKLFYNQGTEDFSYGREIHEVEYIESSGTQYIDTGHAFEDDYSWEIDFEGIQDNTTIFGGRTSSYRTALLYQRVEGVNTTTCPIAGLNGSSTPFQLADLRTGRHKVNMSVAPNEGPVWVDDVQVYDNASFSGTYISGTTQALFADNFGNSVSEYTSSKVYNLKMWQGSNIVRNFVPAIDENGVGFMFDRVTHTIYDNNGTGIFTYPTIELDYIESTGIQYIDTGVVLSSTDKVEVSVEYTGEPTQGSSYAFGAFGSSKNFGINCTLKSTPKNWYGVWYNQGTLTSSTIFSDLNTRYDIQVSSNGMYINDNLMTTVSGTFTGSISAYLFWAHGTSQPKSLMKLYSCKMWQSDTLVRDFIPCYKDGVLGLLDKVNDVFYDNDGTGTFVAGKAKESRWF